MLVSLSRLAIVAVVGLIAIAGVSAAAPAVKSPRLLYAMGDSILGGARASDVAHRPLTLVAKSFPGTIFDQAVGGRTLAFYARDPARTAVVVGAVVAKHPTDLWIELGYNDYSGAVWTAAAFGKAYGDFVDALRARLPDLIVYCQTPTDAHDPTPRNAAGDTLEDFRIATRAACQGKPHTVVIDGRDFIAITAADHADSVHLNDAGYAKYAAAITATLGR